MAIYRNVQLSFWTDNKVEDEFTPEDKYFYLYLLTNPQTNICGCYEVSYSQMTRQTGYNKETIQRLLERFGKVHNVVRFSKETKEVLILHWYKYNWSKSEKVMIGVDSVAKHIKNQEFKDYVYSVIDMVKNGNSDIPYPYTMETSVSDTDSDTDSVSDSITDTDNKEIYKRIIDYLNIKCNTRYRHTTENTRKHIRARMAEGYSEDDFYIVIDKKCSEWIGTEQEKYLRPDTLFGSKFESYLNQRIIKNNNRGQPKNRDEQFNKLMEQIRRDEEFDGSTG